MRKADDLLSKMTLIEELLRCPVAVGHVHRAETMALSIARNAPNGKIANLAMQLISVTGDAERSAEPAEAHQDQLNQVLSQLLRFALQEAKHSHGNAQES